MIYRLLCVYLCISFSVLFISGSLSLKAQNSWKIYGYSERDGLPDDEIISCVTHKSGFTYVLTHKGIARFDGNHFLRLTHDPANRKSIPPGRINSLETDDSGNLWLLQSNSISRLMEDGNTFEHYPIPENSEIKQLNFGFHQVNNKIWLGAKGDFLIFDTKLKSYKRSGWRKFSDNQIKQVDLPVNGLSIIAKSPTELWLLGSTGLFSYNHSIGKYTYYRSDKFPDMSGKSLYLDMRNKLYIGSYNDGLIEFDYVKNYWTNYLVPAEFLDEHFINSLYSLFPYSNNEIVGCTRKNLIRFNIETKQYQPILLTDLQGRSLEIQPSILWRDKASNRLWIGSKQGVYRTLEKQLFSYTKLNYDRDNRFFNLYFEDFKNNQVIYGSIYTDELWIQKLNSNNIEIVKSLDGNALDFVTCIKPDKMGNSWLCMRNDVLVRKYGNTKWEKINLPASPAGHSNRAFWSISFDAAGYAYVCSWTDGVLQIDPGFKFVQFLPLNGKNSNIRYSDLEIDVKRDRIYIGTEESGLCIWDILNHKTNWVTSNKNDVMNLPSNSISDLEIDDHGHLWIASQTNGLSLYNPEFELMKNFSAVDGLVSENIHWCFVDSRKRVWAASNSTIYIYHPEVNSFQAFDATTGFPSEEVFYPVQNSVGTILLGTMNGYLSLSETYLDLRLKPPSVYLESVRTDGRFLNTDSTGELLYSENSVLIRYGAIDYRLSSNPIFRYRLLPDTIWHVTSDRQLNLLKLSPGSYKIQISASSDELRWSNPAEYRFIVETPYWRSIWFFLLVLFLFFLLGLLIVRKRISSIRSKAQLKQKIADTEMAALRARMNPHFIFNCLNSIDNLIHADQSELATKYLNKFAKLIRDVLENAQATEIPFPKDWENTQRYLELEQLRFDHQLDIKMEASPELFNGNYRVPPFIIQPFLENAILHGLRNSSKDLKLLHIEARIIDDYICYTIYDNGIGRDAAKALAKNYWLEKSSQGINISRDRIHLHNKVKEEANLVFEDLKDATGASEGTRITVRILI